jgi:hypothetical protein
MVKADENDRSAFTAWVERNERRRLFWRAVWQAVASGLVLNLFLQGPAWLSFMVDLFMHRPH